MRKEIGRKAVLLACALISSITYSSAATYEDVMSIDENSRRFYLGGMGAGFVWANVFAKPVLYCQPMHLRLSGPKYIEIIDEYLEKSGRTELKKQPIELLLLKALQDKFPC